MTQISRRYIWHIRTCWIGATTRATLLINTMEDVAQPVVALGICMKKDAGVTNAELRIRNDTGSYGSVENREKE